VGGLSISRARRGSWRQKGVSVAGREVTGAGVVGRVESGGLQEVDE
jgi:hypothetical protein